jgi:hypothetical protein
MTRHPIPVAALWLAALVVTTPAGAQTDEQQDPVSTAQWKLGGIGFNPGLIVSAGYDSNLNGEAAAEALGGPQIFLIPQMQVVSRAGPLSLSGAVAAEYIEVRGEDELNTLSGQPAANGLWEVTASSGSPRFRWMVGYADKATNAKPTGFEIGARSRRIERSVTAKAAFRILPRFTVVADASTQRTTYSADAVYDDSPLNTALNSRFSGVTVSLDYALTPLTSAFGSASLRRDRFFLSPDRDTDSVLYTGGLSFKPAALLSGTVYAGDRRSRTPNLDRGLLSGPSVGGTLVYSRANGVQVAVDFMRERTYSFDVTAGSFVLKGASVDFTVPLRERWRAFTTAGHHWLDYDSGRSETHLGLAGGVYFRKSERVRIGFHAARSLHEARGGIGREYEGLVATAYLVYGNSQVRPLDRALPR